MQHHKRGQKEEGLHFGYECHHDKNALPSSTLSLETANSRHVMLSVCWTTFPNRRMFGLDSHDRPPPEHLPLCRGCHMLIILYFETPNSCVVETLGGWGPQLITTRRSISRRHQMCFHMFPKGHYPEVNIRRIQRTLDIRFSKNLLQPERSCCARASPNFWELPIP